MMAALLVCGSIGTMAQTDLSGRVYHNPNIVNSFMGDDLDSKMDNLEAEALAKAEKDKGRPLTEQEKTKVKKEASEAKAKAIAAKNAITMAITVEFNSATEAVMRHKTTVDDAALKAIGVGWMKRKAMKAAIALAPKSEKSKYVVKGDLVIMGEGKDLDTLRISADGKYLSGKERKREFKLTRTK